MAEWIKNDLETSGKEWNHLHNVRYLHYSYCSDSLTLSDDEVEQMSEWIKEILYEDPFWSVDEPIQMRNMAVNMYISFLPDLIMDIPCHRLMVFATLVNATGSILLPYHIIRNILHEESMYTLDDMDEFVDQFIEYGYEMEVNYTAGIP